eukprot:TRINITY_DN877_c2_g2_i4.p1 TRINITY_DN877_c2_g2~~TRINITY_DN877_c2_g2_i4.p1  ORF type:complete len:620 (-),score=87.55 TRINITY_DN877_c2_g2_i4:288-2147(-)
MDHRPSPFTGTLGLGERPSMLEEDPSLDVAFSMVNSASAAASHTGPYGVSFLQSLASDQIMEQALGEQSETMSPYSGVSPLSADAAVHGVRTEWYSPEEWYNMRRMREFVFDSSLDVTREPCRMNPTIGYTILMHLRRVDQDRRRKNLPLFLPDDAPDYIRKGDEHQPKKNGRLSSRQLKWLLDRWSPDPLHGVIVGPQEPPEVAADRSILQTKVSPPVDATGEEEYTQRLQDIYILAKASPIYRDTLKRSETFNSCPIMSRETLYRHMDEIMRGPASRIDVLWCPGDGGPGESRTYWPCDVAEAQQERRLLCETLSSLGVIKRGSVVINLFSSTFMHRWMEICNDFCIMSKATSLPLSHECPDERVCEIASKFGCTCLMGTPSRLLQLAHHLSTNGHNLPVEYVIFCGEPLHEDKKQFMSEMFVTDKFRGLYGTAETGVWAFQTDFVREPSYVYDPQLVFLEIAAPLDDLGCGTILMTSLIRKRFPVVRCDTGDIGRLECLSYNGKEYRIVLIKGLHERAFMVGGIYYSLDDFPVLETALDYQVHLSFIPNRAVDRLEFRVLTHTPGDFDAFRRALLERLTSLHWSTVEVEVIPASPSDLGVVCPLTGMPKRIIDTRR